MKSTILSFCPCCNGNIPYIDISYDNPNYLLNIECPCGYHQKKLKLNDYLKYYEPCTDNLITYQSQCIKHKQTYKHYCLICGEHLCYKCLKEHKDNMIIHFDDYKAQITEKKMLLEKAKNFLQEDYEKIKEEINKLSLQKVEDIDQIKEKWYSYYNWINDILLFFSLLLNNYKGDNYMMLSNIIDYNIILDEDSNKCLNDRYESPLIQKDLNHYDILETIVSNNEKQNVCSFLVLKDERYAIAYNQKNEPIVIIDPKNDFQIDFKINDIYDKVYDLAQIDNGYLLGFSSNIIRFWSISKNTYDYIFTLNIESLTVGVAISNNRLLLSNSEIFSLWECNESQSTFIKNVFTDIGMMLIHYIKKKDILIGVCQYALLFIDVKNNQTESIMELEEYPYQLESDDKRIYVGTRNEILMINQETYIIEKEIEKCSSFHLLIQLNENVLLCEGKKHILFIWDIKKEEKRIISFESRRRFGIVLKDYIINQFIKVKFFTK